MRFLIFVAVALAGCKKAEEPVSTEEAKAQVRAFFTAATAGDCPTLRRMLPKLRSPEDCKHYLETWHEAATNLVDVVGAEPDGRDDRAIIVRVRLRQGGREREGLVRAVRGPHSWTLAF